MTDHPKPHWRRRDVLALAPAGAVALAGGPAAVASGAWSRPALYYVLEESADDGAPVRTDLVSAARIPCDAPDLMTTGARISIAGDVRQDDPALSDMTALSLEIDFMPHNPHRHLAWSFARGPAQGGSAPVELYLPVAPGFGVGLHLMVDRAGVLERHEFRLRADAGGGEDVLRSGLFVLALAPPRGWREPGAQIPVDAPAIAIRVDAPSRERPRQV